MEADQLVEFNSQPAIDSDASEPVNTEYVATTDCSTLNSADADPPAAAVTRPPVAMDSDSASEATDDMATDGSDNAAFPGEPGLPPAGMASSGEGSTSLLSSQQKSKVTRALEIIQTRYRLVFTDDGKAYAVDDSGPNPQTFQIGTKEFNSAVRKLVYTMDRDLVLINDELREIASHLEALADLTGDSSPVWMRVAETEEGIEIDIGDASLARIAIRPGSVKVLKQGSPTLFYRNLNFLPFVMPAEKGDINMLLPYLNLEEKDKELLIGWMTYTLAHAKVPATNYVILVLRGDRGTGKTTMCAVIIGSLVGPSSIGVRAFPGSQKDLAIALQHAHVSLFDNLRSFRPSQADSVSRSATAAAVSARELYTDGDEYTNTLHGAMVLNGIHGFIDQDDLAQRCLTLTLQPLDPAARSTEKQLRAKFQQDLPVIFRGVLDLIADILTHLPHVTAMYPERMLEFVHWLAAMEKALGRPEGQLQLAYRNNLVGAMQDTLQDNPLADAMIQFAGQHTQDPWGGTPADLLIELGKIVGQEVIMTRDWPQNPIQLSLRLKKLKSQLSGAGVEITFGKQNKQRHVTVQYTGRSA